jgi:hypothetical protein
MRNATESLRRLDMHIIGIRAPKASIAAGAELPEGKLLRSAVTPATVVLRAVVLMVTANGTAAEPLTLRGMGLTEQVALLGNPEQAKLTGPENPFIPVTARL